MWRHYLYDTMSGQIGAPIDIPSDSWNITVGDSSLSSTKSKGVGVDSLSGVNIPWSAIPGKTMADKRAAITPDATGIVKFYLSDTDLGAGRLGRPIVGGPITNRSDSALDTALTLGSIRSVIDTRYVIREGVYGAAKGGTTTDVVRFRNLSFRGIACGIGDMVTNEKPGGTLPVDWAYLNEKGSHERTYEGWDVQNLSAGHLIELIANVAGGPDMQFRPYLTEDERHVRWRFCAGSDAEIYLSQDHTHSLNYAPRGGTLQDLKVAHLAPIHRVYGSGSGTDKAQTCYMAEDLGLVSNPYKPRPIRESTFADSDTESLSLLRAHVNANLAANKAPLMQLSGSIRANQPGMPVGTYWPGELFNIDIRDYPPLPDGVYETRLMEMSGDNTDTIHVVFDVMEDAGLGL